MTALATAPTERTAHEEENAFRVWGNDPAYLEDEKPWKVLATFRYLLECLDYIAYCQDRQHDVVFQSPADVRPIKHTDRRVVYRPER